MLVFVPLVFFVKQKTAYEMRISDWSSDVCSSDLARTTARKIPFPVLAAARASNIPRLLRHAVHRRNWVSAVLSTRGGSVPQRSRPTHFFPARLLRQIGRASCRERVCQYV